jgi:hypothetical protein
MMPISSGELQKSPKKSDPLHVISLGAGVQSSTMALMAARGAITPMPAAAFFADTHAEPASVYKWLDWLEKQLPFPVIRLSKGDLTAAALTIRDKRDGTGQWSKSCVPAWIRNQDGSSGKIQRQCTYDYKVIPLTRAAIRLMKEEKAPGIVQWIGISLDEVHRMKPSRDKRITHRWPLVDMRLSRASCLNWMKGNWFPKPPRSACIYCPFHSDNEWRRLRDEEPDEFARAVAFDKAYREVKSKTDNMRGTPFLHRSFLPLDEVDFSTGQIELAFGNECEGICGV